MDVHGCVQMILKDYHTSNVLRRTTPAMNHWKQKYHRITIGLLLVG